jgi:hypothetical protein
MKKLLTIAALGLLGVVGCQQQPTPTSQILGTLEVQIGANGVGRAVLRPLASTPVANSAITVGVINSTYGVDANFRYVRAQVNLTANQAFSNLTFYAYNSTGNQGGTAVKNLLNFSGGNTNAEAQSLIPVHSRDASGNYITDTQDLQIFSSQEASSLQSAAVTANVIAAGESVLQYGFVARKNSTTRVFANTDTGIVNIAYRIPATSQLNDAYKFVATFVVADETNGRVSTDIDEAASVALTRSNALVPAAPEVALVIGADSSLNTTKSGGLRFSNIKIGTNTNLLSNMGLAVYRIGDGSAALSNASTEVFVDKFDFTGGASTTTISMPTSTSGGNRALTGAGNATSEGLMTLSENGKCLVLAGYDSVAGAASIAGTSPGTVNRVVGVIDATDNVDTSTALSDASGNPRGVASNNCTNLWLTSNSAGVRYTTLSTVGTSTQLATTPTNLRQVAIAGGQLFVSAQTGSIRLATVGTGLPTVASQTVTNLPGFPTTTGSPYGFYFADLTNTVVGFDTVYVADDSGTANIAKYSLVSGNWVANGSVTLSNTRGMTGLVDGSQVQLFVTNGSSLQTVTDTSGYNATITGTLTSLATAGTNTALRGVALQPR